MFRRGGKFYEKDTFYFPYHYSFFTINVITFAQQQEKNDLPFFTGLWGFGYSFYPLISFEHEGNIYNYNYNHSNIYFSTIIILNFKYIYLICTCSISGYQDDFRYINFDNLNEKIDERIVAQNALIAAFGFLLINFNNIKLISSIGINFLTFDWKIIIPMIDISFYPVILIDQKEYNSKSIIIFQIGFSYYSKDLSWLLKTKSEDAFYDQNPINNFFMIYISCYFI